ncbi:MAG: cytochrome c3 family protein [Planctomycetaceae bacterium]
MNSLEILAFFVVAAVVLLTLVIGRGRSWRIAAMAMTVGAASAALYAPGKSRPPGKADGIPEQVASRRIDLADNVDQYVSSDTCRGCHPGEYASWHKTYHRTMTQLATPQTVLAPFDGVKLEAKDRRYELEQRGDEFWIRMADPDWEAMLQRQGVDLRQVASPPIVERRVFMTTGSHHMQGYWIKSRFGNMMRQVPWFYRIKEKRWLPREDLFVQPPEDKRHFSTWNDTCLHCHTVGGKPLMDLESGTGIPQSEVAELGIACEACHGPAERHIAKHQNPLTRYQFHSRGEPDSSIVNPARLDPKRASEVCGTCHGFHAVDKPRDYAVHGSPFRPGGDLQVPFETVRYEPDLPDKARDIFWNDGTCRTGGDEYNGLSASACYQRGGISCLSCHSMHHSDPNDQLKAEMNSNEACLQCHDSYRDTIEAHTHHPATSSGSLCFNCHMPYSSYALLTAMRSHTIDSPDAGVSIRTERPNACNLCHLDKTFDWTADHLTKWYGAPPVEMDGDQKSIAASLLWLYRGNAVQRAVVANSFGWSDAQSASGTNWFAPHLAALLDDPYSAVRFIGERSLRTLPEYETLEYDYIGSPYDRARAAEVVREVWQSGNGAVGRDDLSTILLKSPGSILQSIVDRLHSARDDTPVKVAE